jgi:hypothetical protein
MAYGRHRTEPTSLAHGHSFSGALPLKKNGDYGSFRKELDSQDNYHAPF